MTKSTAKSKFSTSPSKKTIILVIGLIVICGFAIWTTIKDVAAPPEKQIEKMNDREREFVSSVLDKITSATTKEELVKMWGEPEKNTLNSKLEWWKSLSDGKRTKIIVYFSNNKITQIRMDGGPGSYYWTKDLE